jgi:hypothetical protein
MLISIGKFRRGQLSGLCLVLALLLILGTLDTAWAQDKPSAEDELLRKAAQEDQRAAQARDAASTGQAKITEVTGKHVQYSLDGGKTWQAAQKGVKLNQGDSIRTGFASSCELSFAAHTVVQIQPLSAIKVSEYTSTVSSAKVQTNLHYGAVRCGVMKGRIKADTRISTPVSTLSIRGTLVSVDYDPGTRQCMLRVDEDGPALASTFGAGCKDCQKRRYVETDPNQLSTRQYELVEGMHTDCTLSRYLKLAIFERAVWVTGNYELAGVTGQEADATGYIEGVIDPTDGALQYSDDRNRENQRVSDEIIDYNEGDIPIGDVTPPTDYYSGSSGFDNTIIVGPGRED